MPFPVDAKWTTQTEHKLGVRFPTQFASAIEEMNGGIVRTGIDKFELFPFMDASDRKRIQRTSNSIDRETNVVRKNWKDFPDDAVAIGENGAGDLLVYLSDPDRPGWLRDSVHWWNHETGEIQKVVDDFNELLRS